MVITHKNVKFVALIIILNLGLIIPSIQGTFGVEVGQKIKYKIINSYTGGYYDFLTSDFSGFTFSEDIIPTEEILTVMVESITVSDLTWNATLNGITEHGVCPLILDQTDLVFAILTGFNLLFEFDLTAIASSGEIDPYYLPPFIFPLFIDASPSTWDLIDFLADNKETINPYASVFSEKTTEVNVIETTETYTFAWWFNGTIVYSVDPYEPLICFTNSTFTYDKAQGLLLHSENLGNFYGVCHSDYFDFRLEHQVTQTDMSDFEQFLYEYKWYFIGGGAGLAVLILSASILIGVRKRKHARRRKR